MGFLLGRRCWGLGASWRGRGWAGAFGFAVAAYAGYLGVLRGDPVVDRIADEGVQNVLLVVAVVVCWVGSRRLGAQRAVWRLVSAALALWAIATVLWTVVLEHMEVSIADAFWLAGYPLLYGALVIRVRDRVSTFHFSVWLDGLIGVLGMSAVAAVLWPALYPAPAGSDPWAIVVNLAYPLADVVLLVLLAGAAVLVRGRLGRPLVFLALGMGVTAIGDLGYVIEVATGADGHGPSLLDAVFVAGTALMALGAWQTPGDQEIPLDGWRVLLLPGALTVAALGLLAWSAVARLAAVPALLALATLITVAIRAAATFRENLALLDARVQAHTDELTGLLNRRGSVRSSVCGRGDAIAAGGPQKGPTSQHEHHEVQAAPRGRRA